MNLDMTVGLILTGLSVSADTTLLCLETTSGDYSLTFGPYSWFHSVRVGGELHSALITSYGCERAWVLKTRTQETITTYELSLNTTLGVITVELQATEPLRSISMKNLHVCEYLMDGFVKHENGDVL